MDAWQVSNLANLFLACCTLITPSPYISMNWQLCYACKNAITVWDVLMGPVPNQYLCHCMSIASDWFLHCMLHVTFTVSDIVQLKCDGTRWHTGWEVRGKLVNGVGSQYPSHYQPVPFTLPRNTVYPALLPLMRTPRLWVFNWTDAPADLNGLVRFAKRRNLVSVHVPSHFKCSLPTNPLTPHDPYMGRTALLTSGHCILYIYSTNIRTEYFKHATHTPFFFSLFKMLFIS